MSHIILHLTLEKREHNLEKTTLLRVLMHYGLGENSPKLHSPPIYGSSASGRLVKTSSVASGLRLPVNL